MSAEKNKWIDAVGKLLTLTQERKLIWRVGGYLSDEETTPVYETDYAGKTLRLKGNTLSLVDPETGVEWDLPLSEAVLHLKEAVKYQLVGVCDFLDELLAKAV